MAGSMPRFIGVGRGGKYLRYVLEEGELHSRMQLASDEVISERSFTKLEVLSGETSWQEAELVHIRSSYNNKFLVLASEGDAWVVAGADEPEADRSKWSCTLFRAVYDQGDKLLRLFLQSAGAEHGVQIIGAEQCLSIVRDSTSTTLFDVVDLASLAILPKHVAFKGDNDKYLIALPILAHKRLEFSSDDLINRRVHHESFTLPNGDVRLRSDTYNRFWRKSGDDWIWCESADTTATNSDTVFRPMRLDNQGNTIALLNLGNNKYCRRQVGGGLRRLRGTLIASSARVIPEAVMEVEEAINEREIYDVDYRVEDARIYDVGLVNNVIQTTSNMSKTNTANKSLTFTYTKMTQETFSSSHSWKVKVSIQMKARIPVLVQGSIRMDVSYEGSVEWSEMKETTEQVSSSIRVAVPPMTKAVVTMLIGRGSIDVPYSYTQRDILHDGRVVTTRMHDGIFTGVNTEMIDYTIVEESLSEVSSMEAEEARAPLSSKL